MAFSPIRYELTPAIGGIGGPVSGFENVKSDLFAKTLTENQQLEYAAAAKLAQTGLSGEALAQRQALAEEGALDRLKLTQEQAKRNQKLKLIQGLLSGGDIAQVGAVDPMTELLAINKGFGALDSARNTKLAGNNELAKALILAMKNQPKDSGGGVDLTGLMKGIPSTQLKPEPLNALDIDMIKEFVKQRKPSESTAK